MFLSFACVIKLENMAKLYKCHMCVCIYIYIYVIAQSKIYFQTCLFYYFSPFHDCVQ